MLGIAYAKRIAPGTGFRSVCGVNQKNLNSTHLSFVGDKFSQLKKRPTMKDSSKTPSMLCGFPDVRQILKRDGRTVLIGELNNPFRNAVVDILLKPFLPARGVFQMPSGAGSAFALKMLSQSMITISNRLNMFAGECCFIAAYCDFLYSKIDSENIRGIFWRFIGDFYDQIKKVFAVPLHDLTIAELGRSGKHLFLVFAENKYYFFSFVCCGNRRRFNAVKRKRPIVTERKNRLFENMLLLFLGFIGEAHFVFDVAANLGRKMKFGFDSIIDQMMKSDSVETLFLPCDLRNIAQRLKTFGQGFVQNFDLSLRRVQSAFDGYLHSATSISYRKVFVNHYLKKGEGQFIRQPKQAVSLPCFL